MIKSDFQGSKQSVERVSPKRRGKRLENFYFLNSMFLVPTTPRVLQKGYPPNRKLPSSQHHRNSSKTFYQNQHAGKQTTRITQTAFYTRSKSSSHRLFQPPELLRNDSKTLCNYLPNLMVVFFFFGK